MTQTSDTPSRKCDLCAGEMKLLGRLPRRANQAQRLVFRCAGCDNVVQEQS